MTEENVGARLWNSPTPGHRMAQERLDLPSNEIVIWVKRVKFALRHNL